MIQHANDCKPHGLFHFGWGFQKTWKVVLYFGKTPRSREGGPENFGKCTMCGPKTLPWEGDKTQPALQNRTKYEVGISGWRMPVYAGVRVETVDRKKEKEETAR